MIRDIIRAACNMYTARFLLAWAVWGTFCLYGVYLVTG